MRGSGGKPSPVSARPTRYDRALGRHSTALVRLLRAPAPDLAAAAEKLELIVRHHLFELRFGAAAIAVVRRDIGRFAALPSS